MNGDAMPMSDAEEAPDTISIPRSVLGDRQCKPGEILRMEVVDADEDGAEVKLADNSYGDKSGGESTDEEMSRYPMET